MPFDPGLIEGPSDNSTVIFAVPGPSSPPNFHQSPSDIDSCESDQTSEEGEGLYEEDKHTLQGVSGGVLLTDEVDEDVPLPDAENWHNTAQEEFDGMEMDSEDRATPPTRPRDIFSPQHRIPRAPTPPTNRLANLLHLLSGEERELILSLDQETRSNISREEGDNPSIDSIMEDQLAMQYPAVPASSRQELDTGRDSEDLSTADALSETPSMDIGTDFYLNDNWNDFSSTTSTDTSQASTEATEQTTTHTEDSAGRQESPGAPASPFELLRLPLFPSFLTSIGVPRPIGGHFLTAEELYEDGLGDGYDEPIIDIETDNLDFSRLCRRLYDYYPFDPTTFRLTSLAAQIKGLKRPDEVTREDMESNGGDYQGIPWDSIGMTREEFRVPRNQFYKNYRNIPHFAYSKPDPLPNNRRFFRFNRQENTKRTRVVHFQLRNLLSVASRNDIFYSSEHCCIRRTSVGSKRSEIVIDLSGGVGGGSGIGTGSPVKITTMTARHGVCIAGGFSGEYAMKSIYAPFESKPITGTVTLNDNGITNHVHSHLGRNSGSPVAVFSSNDNKLRVLDCYTNTFIGEQTFRWPINCSATSPDGRLRVVVGDYKDVMIVDADSGNVLRTLEGHQDYGFSCAWSDDGYSIATGNQDRTVRIYDARNFSRSITQIGTNIAGVRTLRFSENGCGRRVLVAPEPADYVNVIDAVTWDGMQKFDFFGEIAGVEFSPKGGEMFVANADTYVGGLMEFERWRDEKWDIWEGEDGIRSPEVDKEDGQYEEDEDEEGEQEMRKRNATGRLSTTSTPIRQQRRRSQVASPSTPSSPYNRIPTSVSPAIQRLRGTAATPPRNLRNQTPSIDRSMTSPSPSPSQIHLPPSPSPITSAVASNWPYAFSVPSPPRFNLLHRGRLAGANRRWGIIQDPIHDFGSPNEDGTEEDEELDVDTVVDFAGDENEDDEEGFKEEEFAKWKAERIREAIKREEDAWGSRRKKRMGVDASDLFV